MPTNNPTGQGGFISRLKSLLGSLFNLFPLNGANGGIIIRHKGAAPGTAVDGQIFNNGSGLILNTTANSVVLQSAGVTVAAFNGTNCTLPATMFISNNFDTALTRQAAGNVKVTDGSTGNGTLLMGASPGSTSAPLSSNYIAACETLRLF